MDLDNLKQLSGPHAGRESARIPETWRGLFRTLYDFPKPTIAAVNGAAIAGGTGLATLCDFTLAVPEAKFGYTEVRIGFVPAIVSSFSDSPISERNERAICCSRAGIFGAEEAHRLGLVNEIVAPEKLMQRALELAAQLMENSPRRCERPSAAFELYERTT